jgi:hypothetical protein
MKTEFENVFLVDSVSSGGGEMGALMRAFDWSQTPVGPVSKWPQSLRTAARIILTSRYAMFIWWGRELVNLYNNPYREFLGIKHPAALGFSSRTRSKNIQVYPEIKGDTEIYAVPGEIRQVIANLLSNSIDAVQKGGRIRIRVSAASEWNENRAKGVRFTVADITARVFRLTFVHSYLNHSSQETRRSGRASASRSPRTLLSRTMERLG